MNWRWIQTVGQIHMPLSINIMKRWKPNENWMKHFSVFMCRTILIRSMRMKLSLHTTYNRLANFATQSIIFGRCKSKTVCAVFVVNSMRILQIKLMKQYSHYAIMKSHSMDKSTSFVSLLLRWYRPYTNNECSNNSMEINQSQWTQHNFIQSYG